ncbi:molecular chaperone [Rahnella sp. Larv3_ips]|uniref:fimbrial biogenesis chaperone n=1 Tax=Rahnella sp. Larv3_ips TaxID=1896943 RepID=UPI000EFDAD14|nr:fimbria/pilus periplasmic chaperone [Rahnella sp. Larv3_ips]
MRNISLFAVLSFICFSSTASVVLNSTRVIFPSESKSVSVQLVNKSKNTHLVQSWIDDGRAEAKPEELNTPFMISPPVVKINANDGQTLRISKNTLSEALPKDRESLFWLNVIDVPPEPENAADNGNYLQVAIRNRIKLFWRPASLKISADKISDLVSLKRSENGKLCADNPTPYYVTVSQVMKWDGKSRTVQNNIKGNLLDGAMTLSPFSCQPINKMPATPGKYQMVHVDDYGSRVPFVVEYK